MNESMLLRSIMLFSLFATLGDSVNTLAADRVVVELDSGRRLRADAIEPDPLDASRAIMTISGPQLQMRRGVTWARVRRLAAPAETLASLQVPSHVEIVDPAVRAEKSHEVELKLESGEAERNRTALRSFFRHAPPPPVSDDSTVRTLIPPGEPCLGIEGPCRPYCDPGVVVGVRYENPATVTEQPRPKELVVSARCVNRNGLADWNALEVSVQGRTADGVPCQVRGSLKCTLWARRAQLVRSYGENYFEEPLDLIRLEHWSRFLDGSANDAYAVQKVVLNLPPSSSDHNLRLSSFGLLTVELDIPGQGRLATSTEAIPLRQFGPVRSRGVVDFGSSILPMESVSEGTLNSGDWPEPLSGLRPDSRRFTVQP
jgi:hypothetical protein